MKLNDLTPNNPKKNRKRVGHGISAGQGKTAGRGTKGEKSRTGSGGRLYRQGGNLHSTAVYLSSVVKALPRLTKLSSMK